VWLFFLQVSKRLRSGSSAGGAAAAGVSQGTAARLPTAPLLMEIVGDKHRDLVLRWSDGREETLPCRLRMADAVRCLAERLAGEGPTHADPYRNRDPSSRPGGCAIAQHSLPVPGKTRML
jgi:hypothetical protein